MITTKFNVLKRDQKYWSFYFENRKEDIMTDKIIIKSDSKGNVEAIRHTKEENAKAQRILKEIRDSYYKNSKR